MSDFRRTNQWNSRSQRYVCPMIFRYILLLCMKTSSHTNININVTENESESYNIADINQWKFYRYWQIGLSLCVAWSTFHKRVQHVTHLPMTSFCIIQQQVRIFRKKLSHIILDKVRLCTLEWQLWHQPPSSKHQKYFFWCTTVGIMIMFLVWRNSWLISHSQRQSTECEVSLVHVLSKLNIETL